MIQVHRRDSAAVVRSPQELATRPVDDRDDMDHLGVGVGADPARHQLHRSAARASVAVHVLQRRFPHLLVDGVVLRALLHHDRPLLAHLPRDPTSRAEEQVLGAVVGVVGRRRPAPLVHRRRHDDDPASAARAAAAAAAGIGTSAAAAPPAGAGGHRGPAGRLLQSGRRRPEVAAAGGRRRRRRQEGCGRRRAGRSRTASTGAADISDAIWRVAEKRRQLRV